MTEEDERTKAAAGAVVLDSSVLLLWLIKKYSKIVQEV